MERQNSNRRSGTEAGGDRGGVEAISVSRHRHCIARWRRWRHRRAIDRLGPLARLPYHPSAQAAFQIGRDGSPSSGPPARPASGKMIFVANPVRG